MKLILACIGLSVASLCSISRSQEEAADIEAPYEIRPIKSLDDIQGHWMFVPKGDRGFGGHTLDIKGEKGRFREVTDTPQEMPDDEVGLELAGGGLLLKSDSPDVPKNKWRLAQLGEFKCLFRFATRKQSSPQPYFYIEVLYLHPPKDGAKVGAGKKSAISD